MNGSAQLTAPATMPHNDGYFTAISDPIKITVHLPDTTRGRMVLVPIYDRERQPHQKLDHTDPLGKPIIAQPYSRAIALHRMPIDKLHGTLPNTQKRPDTNAYVTPSKLLIHRNGNESQPNNQNMNNTRPDPTMSQQRHRVAPEQHIIGNVQRELLPKPLPVKMAVNDVRAGATTNFSQLNALDNFGMHRRGSDAPGKMEFSSAHLMPYTDERNMERSISFIPEDGKVSPLPSHAAQPIRNKQFPPILRTPMTNEQPRRLIIQNKTTADFQASLIKPPTITTEHSFQIDSDQSQAKHISDRGDTTGQVNLNYKDITSDQRQRAYSAPQVSMRINKQTAADDEIMTASTTGSVSRFKYPNSINTLQSTTSPLSQMPQTITKKPIHAPVMLPHQHFAQELYDAKKNAATFPGAKIRTVDQLHRLEASHPFPNEKILNRILRNEESQAHKFPTQDGSQAKQMTHLSRKSSLKKTRSGQDPGALGGSRNIKRVTIAEQPCDGHYH